MRLFSSRVLCFVAFLSISPFSLQAQDSPLSLPPLEPLWQTLLKATSDLPTLIDSYTANWTLQVVSLQSNVSQLQTSNDSLTQQNADLEISLLRSRADLAISEQEQKLSEILLNDSMLHTEVAQREVKRLEAQNALLRYGMIGAVAVTVVSVVIAAVK